MFEWQVILRALKYEMRVLIGTTVGITLVGLAAIIYLPDIYISGSKILVEREDLFAATENAPVSRTDNLGRRLHAIISTVMSTESIKEMLTETGLVDSSIPRDELVVAIREFRKKANLNFDNVAVVNQYTGKSGMYSQGLDISYESEDPELAYAVAAALTNRVIEANEGKGERVRTFRLQFLTDKYERAREEWTQAREAVAEFKNENALYLPEVHPLAIRRFGDIETQLRSTEDELARLRRNLDDVRADLATTSPDSVVIAPDGSRILSVSEQLRQLEVEYAKARSRYSDQHPEVQRLRTELEGMRAYRAGSDSGGLEAELQETRKALAAARQRYTEAHPDVKSLSKKVANLESQLKAALGRQSLRRASTASNPAFNRLQVREQAIIDETARQERKLVDLDVKRDEVREQLARMPGVEQRLDSLEQKSETAELEYEEVQAELRRVQEIDERTNADILDRFVLLEEPVVPVKPARPHRKLLAVVLAMLAGATGMLAAILLHLFRDRIYNSDDVEAMYELPVYMIPKVS